MPQLREGCSALLTRAKCSSKLGIFRSFRAGIAKEGSALPRSPQEPEQVRFLGSLGAGIARDALPFLARLKTRSKLRFWPHSERVTGVEPASTAWEAVVLPMNYTRKGKLERAKGVEPMSPAWKAGVLPLNYTREE